MKKICVLGIKGMAGHVIFNYLLETNNYEVYGVARNIVETNNIKDIDISNTEKLIKYFDEKKFDCIINCVGLLNKNAEENIDKAIFLNSYLPHLLEAKYKNTTTKIIHISTDCVFSGEKGNYVEKAFKDGDTIYDRTKALGEIVNDKDLTFRMSIVGPDCNKNGIGLFNWFIKQEENINGYTHAIWTGVTTIELAKAIDEAIKQNIVGLYHLVPSEGISKYDLLRIFNKYFKNDEIVIGKNEEIHINKRLVNTRNDFNFLVPSYEEMVKEMREWVLSHNELYYETIIKYMK